MVGVRVQGDELQVEVLGSHRLWALKRRLRVPLSHVVSVRRAIDEDFRRTGLRLPGTYVPGLIIAGTFRRRGARSFFDVRRKDRAIVIELHDDAYVRVVVEVVDPDETVSVIERARRAA